MSVPARRRDPGGTVRPQRQWPLLVVTLGVVGGLVAAAFGSTAWRDGCVAIGVSLVVGALLRLTLSNRQAGLLVVRSRGFDVAVMLLTGGAIVALSYVVPPGR